MGSSTLSRTTRRTKVKQIDGMERLQAAGGAGGALLPNEPDQIVIALVNTTRALSQQAINASVVIRNMRAFVGVIRIGDVPEHHRADVEGYASARLIDTAIGLIAVRS